MPLAFVTILSGIHFPQTSRLLCRAPNLPYPSRRKPPLQPRAELISPSQKENQVADIATQLRTLDAPAAADQAYVALSDPNTSIPSTWIELLLLLKDYGITGEPLSRISSRLGVLSLLSVSPSSTASLIKFLDTSMSLSVSQKRRIFSNQPDLLQRDMLLVKASLEELKEAGLRLKDLKRLVMTWPRMLLLHPTSINRVTRFLQHSPLWIPKQMLKPILRRAPWILVFDIDSQMAPAAYWLDEYVFPFLKEREKTRFILSAPMVLGRSRGSLNDVLEFLRKNTRLTDEQQVSVLRQFPLILTFSVDEVLQPTVDYFINDLHFTTSEVSRLIHAFPRIITLQVEQDIMPVMNFFVLRKIRNVSRIIKRFPPILTNDLSTDTIPKMEYFEHELGLPVHDILKFPGYFSYNLETRIIPRTKFAQANRVSIFKVGLSRVIASSDETFCKLMKKTQESYKLFCEPRIGPRELVKGRDIFDHGAGKKTLGVSRTEPT